MSGACIKVGGGGGGGGAVGKLEDINIIFRNLVLVLQHCVMKLSL